MSSTPRLDRSARKFASHWSCCAGKMAALPAGRDSARSNKWRKLHVLQVLAASQRHPRRQSSWWTTARRLAQRSPAHRELQGRGYAPRLPRPGPTSSSQLAQLPGRLMSRPPKDDGPALDAIEDLLRAGTKFSTALATVLRQMGGTRVDRRRLCRKLPAQRSSKLIVPDSEDRHVCVYEESTDTPDTS